MSHGIGSKKRLSPRAAVNYPGDTLFDRVARSLCEAGCLPRKEFHESWAFSSRLRRRLKQGRIVDLAAGHGLLGQLLLLMDKTHPEAVAVDLKLPPCGPKIQAALAAHFPQLVGRFRFEPGDLAAVQLGPGDLVVSAHACGALTDQVLAQAVAAGASVAVLPCCHAHQANPVPHLEGWLDPDLAMDVGRAERLRKAGYRVHTGLIPAEITPKNRFLLGWPDA